VANPYANPYGGSKSSFSLSFHHGHNKKKGRRAGGQQKDNNSLRPESDVQVHIFAFDIHLQASEL
jgi:hypothetical protein